MVFLDGEVDSVVRLSSVKTKTVPSGDMTVVEAAAASDEHLAGDTGQ
jgi:hypothetical protein